MLHSLTQVNGKDVTVDKRASELYNTGEILGRLEELQNAAADQAIIDRQCRMKILTEIAEDKGEKADSRIRAIDTLNKMDGEYVTKLEVSKNMDDTVKEMEEYFGQTSTDTPNAEI